MELINKLTAFAEKLETSGFLHLASDVDGATVSIVKTARELGPQGYWVRNERCFAGCYRSKRASTKKASQDIWFECLEEYQKSLRQDSPSWDKYAGSGGFVRTAATATLEQRFASQIAARIEQGSDAGTAVFESIRESGAAFHRTCIASSEQMGTVADSLRDYDFELAKEAADLSADIIKEAQFWQHMKGIGQGVSNMFTGRNDKSQTQPSKMGPLIKQLRNTLNIYRTQKNKIQQQLSNVISGTSKVPTYAQAVNIAKQMTQLLQHGNEKNFNQLDQLNIQLEKALATAPAVSSEDRDADGVADSVDSTPPAAPQTPPAPAAGDDMGTLPEKYVMDELGRLPQDVRMKILPELNNALRNVAKTRVFSLVKTSQTEDEMAEQMRAQLAHKRNKAAVPPAAAATGAAVAAPPAAKKRPKRKVVTPPSEAPGVAAPPAADSSVAAPAADATTAPAPIAPTPAPAAEPVSSTGQPLAENPAVTAPPMKPEAKPAPATAPVTAPAAEKPVTPPAAAKPTNPTGVEGVEPIDFSNPDAHAGPSAPTAPTPSPAAAKPAAPSAAIDSPTFEAAMQRIQKLNPAQRAKFVRTIEPIIERYKGKGGNPVGEALGLKPDAGTTDSAYASSKKSIFKLA